MILYLNGIYVGLLILAIIVAVKLFSIGDFAIFPAAVIIYVLAYPIIDWLRNNASTMLSQLGDPTIFYCDCFLWNPSLTQPINK